MTRFKYLALPLALAGVPFSGLTLHAQGGPQQPQPRLVLQALDTDGDGTLSAAEIQAATASLLKLDRNHDGTLSADEFLPQQPDRQSGGGADIVQLLLSMDKNGDGVLTADELPDRMQPIFQRGDTDHDGKLTADEIKALARAQSGPKGRPLGRNGADGVMRMDPLINAIDIDHDGVLSSAELASATGALKALDTNADGILQPQEMRIRQQTPGERAAHMLDEWDTDKDGSLSKAESPDRMQKQFEAIDTNHDGKLNLEELTTFFATQTQPGRGEAPRNDAPSERRLPPAGGQNATPAQPQQ